MSATSPFGRTVDDVAGLRELYRQPSDLVRSKVRGTLDPVSRRFLEMSTLVFVGTISDDGRLDVSPRGGPPGFVATFTAGEGSDLVLLPDLNGNNLLDTFSNVVATGRCGLIFVVPGKDETLRVNGRAWVVVEAEMLDRCASESLARPKAALGVQVEESFMHCAKAFRRGKVWEPISWHHLAGAPDGVDLLEGAGLIPSDMVQATRMALDDGYRAELAADRPAGTGR